MNSLAKPQLPQGLSFRRQAIGATVCLLGTGGLLGTAGGLATTEAIDGLPNFSDELRFWPVAALCCLLIAILGYKTAGIKGLLLSATVPVVFWGIGILILGVGVPGFAQLVNWVADGPSKLRHAVVGGLLGVALAVPVLPYAVYRLWLDFKAEKRRCSLIPPPEENLPHLPDA